jgi:hypothetical protein
MKHLLILLLSLGLLAPLPALEPAASRIQTLDGTVFVKRATASIAASTTGGTLVAAVPGKRLRIVSMVMVSGGTATSVTILGNTTALSPPLPMGVNSVMALPVSEHGWFETAVGEGLKVTTGTGATTGIAVTYIELNYNQ